MTSAFNGKYEKLLPLFLFLIFLAVSAPGANWGVPALWNPDELVWRVDQALAGNLVFDETEPDYNYPSLPKYIMFGIGKVIYGFGYSRSTFFIAARLFSAFLGALAAVFVYYLARLIKMNVFPSALAGLLYIAGCVAAVNSRFAHNDLYLQLFAVICVFCAIKYQFTKFRFWIYCSFFAVGLAASSKYTGGSLVLIPLFVYVFMNWQERRRDWFQSVETLFLGAVLTFGGYALGTPKALFWMVYYFKRALPAIGNYPQYGQSYGSPIGLFGQWSIFQSAVGWFVYCVFILCIIWAFVKLILTVRGRVKMDPQQMQGMFILAATLVLFDLPYLISINYIERHFIPFVPFFSVLGALFIAEMIDLAKKDQRRFVLPALYTLIGLGMIYSFLRLVGVALLFLNDARTPASDFIAQLPGDQKTIEYTLYPPRVNKAQFGKARNYPIYFVKYPGETAPQGGKIEYNQGELGLIERDVDYLVIDTFTYMRFYKPSVCKTNTIECDFFMRLLEGKVTTFHLIATFTYELPGYLPEINLNTVNPEIRIYERVLSAD